MDNIQAIIDAVQKSAAPTVLASNEYVQWIHTPTRGLERVSTDVLNDKPFRKTGSVTVLDPESFNALLAANAMVGHTTVYVDPDANNPAVVAVINGNGLGGEGFGDFRVSIGFRQTPQWIKWKAIDGKLLPQTEFAEFVEDNLEDIATPDGAQVMEIVTYLQATRSVDFKSGIRLSNGQVQFTNIESVDATVGVGNIAVPDLFELGLSPIFGVQPFKIPARFRYRIEDRKLKLGIKLQRVETIMAQIIKEIEAEIVLPDGVVKVYGMAP